ncbi:13574_t:CDS:1 [Ambispora gerdemannii]|uniref:13574_t:CDS:1 n=1 Tax=Ambispora gerdemannii TaxID=144530 RepID=A0A9N9GZ63_9GLOM|nr:13574_t:CDS:1 [Ambispora gerdemannii]
MINETLAKQKSDSDTEIEKLRKEVQSQKAQKTQVLVELVKQPKGPPLNLKTEKDYENYYLAKFFNDLDIYYLDSNYPEKSFQRSHPQQKDNSKLEEKVDEIGNMLSRLNIDNQTQKPIAKSNRTQRYYLFQPINYSVSANKENNGYDEEKDIWYDLLGKKWILPVNKLSSEELKTQYFALPNQPKTYNKLFSKLSLVMRKMYQSHTVQKKESDE